MAVSPTQLIINYKILMHSNSAIIFLMEKLKHHVLKHDSENNSSSLYDSYKESFMKSHISMNNMYYIIVLLD